MTGRLLRIISVVTLFILGVVLCTLALSGASRADDGAGPGNPRLQGPPPAYTPAGGGLPPVDLNIPNIPQRTGVWCWAAVAQQVIIRKRGFSPPQCALVAMVHGQRPSTCCPHYRNCAVPGRISQIRKLIRNFGRSASSLERPTDAMTLYRTLRAGRPVIIALRNTRYSGHTVVVTGMTWIDTPAGRAAMLHINDPIGALPPRVPYRIILSRWEAAIVVH